jgi:2-dehydro-3-deoxyphosphogluconate aldolase / (4S)-4-hydroxy-2-oxoglutarate aldolase
VSGEGESLEVLSFRRVKSIDRVFPTGVCGVIRTDDADAAFQACLAAIEGGIGTIEVTTTVPSWYEIVRGLIGTTVGKVPIGVGTVWDPGAVGEAKEAGADFIVTPVLLPEVAEECRKEDVLCVLGALTPTEIYHARLAGANLVKVFPVGPVGGPDYIKSLLGPMGGVPLWASGGVEIEHIAAYLRLGVKAVGLTGALFPAEALAKRDMEAVRNRASRAAEASAAARAD